jgi:putative DNA primase/helicase
VYKLGNDQARERWLCEGYASGLSARAALRDMGRDSQVIVCFSAGNLVHVAPHVRRPALVMADNDESGAGRRAAEESGLPWVMPPDVGCDANDWHQRYGLRALVKLMLR